ncbi:MAG: LuxR C-terminal-related transcriptional regulator [Actinomycetota bacterium]
MGRTNNPDLRVGVVDGYPLARAGLRAFLGSAAGIRLVGEVDDGEGALRLVAEQGPDLLVLGYDLSTGPNGAQVCRSIKSAPDPPRVLALAGNNFAEAMLPLFLAGADSYMPRRSDRAAILEAVHRTAAGERIWTVPEGIEASSMLQGDPAAPGLTPRELEVLTLKLHRRTNSEIAQSLNISLHTVKHHVTRIIRKLGETSEGT